jgi:hypothetical protein
VQRNRNNRLKRLFRDSTFGGLKIDDPALQPDRDRMRPVVRPEFRNDFTDVAFHGLLSYSQPGGDFFIRVSLCD